MMKRILLIVAGSVIGLAFVSSPVPNSDKLDTVALAAGAPAHERGMAGMQMGMQDMMKMHEKMMGDMKASHAKLDELAKKMNSAMGDAKVTAMAELLTELVRQHKMMGEQMGGMQKQMMGHMK